MRVLLEAAEIEGGPFILTASRRVLGEPPVVTLRYRTSPEAEPVSVSSTSWYAADGLAQSGLREALARSDGPVSAELKVDEVAFTAKNGSQRGREVAYSVVVVRKGST